MYMYADTPLMTELPVMTFIPCREKTIPMSITITPTTTRANFREFVE